MVIGRAETIMFQILLEVIVISYPPEEENNKKIIIPNKFTRYTGAVCVEN